MLSRRQFAASLVVAPAILRGAQAALPALPNIAPGDATFVVPGDPDYDADEISYNKRTELRPRLRVMVGTARGMAQTVDWLAGAGIPFALRSGGHSFEGFSQSSSVVVDTRPMASIALAADRLTVGAGATLGAIYKFVAARGLAFPGGSCPTVGVSGHALGGGFGLLARERGLACDALAGIAMIGADARPVHADAEENPELFWAVRGGGGGTFGAATALTFRVAPIGALTTYSATWSLGLREAAALFRAWQDWAPQAPDAITGIFKISALKGGRIEMHVAGQSTGSAAQLRRELRALTDAAQPAHGPTIAPMSYLGAINHFSGGWGYESKYSKGKSDYVTRKLDDAGIEALLGGLAALPPGEVIAICDAYGGAIARVADDATAFAYRAGTLFCIQYYTSWLSAAAGARRLADIRRLYAAMRPWSGGAYVNYCDLDLPDWQQAYWRQNLPRLRAIKAKADPRNLFRHAQSVPPA